MSWQWRSPLGDQSPFGIIDWNTSLSIYNTDPYLVWLDSVSTMKGKASDSEGVLSRWVAVLVELSDESGWEELLFVRDDVRISIPSHLFPVNENIAHRFVPMLFAPAALSRLISEFVSNGKVLNYEYCQPRSTPTQVVDKLNLYLKQKFNPIKPQQKRPDGARDNNIGAPIPHPPPDLTDENDPQRIRHQLDRSATPAIAVIDDRCNFASPRLRSVDGNPVVHGIWHQSRDQKVYDRLDKVGAAEGWTSAWRYDGTTFFGAVNGRRFELDAAKLNNLGDELEAYRKSQYMPVMQSWSHGSAVTDAIVNGPGLRRQSQRTLRARISHVSPSCRRRPSRTPPAGLSPARFWMR